MVLDIVSDLMSTYPFALYVHSLSNNRSFGHSLRTDLQNPHAMEPEGCVGVYSVSLGIYDHSHNPPDCRDPMEKPYGSCLGSLLYHSTC
jgi:hypothetical protein